MAISQAIPLGASLFSIGIIVILNEKTEGTEKVIIYIWINLIKTFTLQWCIFIPVQYTSNLKNQLYLNISAMKVI